MQGFSGGVLIPLAFTIITDHAAEGEAADRPGAVRDVRDLRAGDRPDHRRLSDRELRLAVHLLRQPGAGRDHAGDAVAVAEAAHRCSCRCCARATGPASPPWRSGSPRCRPCWRKATRTTGSARPSSCGCRSLPPSSLSLFFWIELTTPQPAAQSAPAGRGAISASACLANFLLGIALYGSVYHPAGLSVADPGLQFRADRHGAGLDRPAAAGADPAGAAADEALRRAAGDRRRLRPVRRSATS